MGRKQKYYISLAEPIHEETGLILAHDKPVSSRVKSARPKRRRDHHKVEAKRFAKFSHIFPVDVIEFIVPFLPRIIVYRSLLTASRYFYEVCFKHMDKTGALDWGIKNNQAQLLEKLFTLPEDAQSSLEGYYYPDAGDVCMRNRYPDVLAVVLEYKYDKIRESHAKNWYLRSIRERKYEIAEAILKSGKIEIKHVNVDGVRLEEYTLLVRYRQYIGETSQQRRFAKKAVKHGYIPLVEELQKLEGFDITFANHLMVKIAFTHAMEEILLLLFNDSRVDPTNSDNQFLISAVSLGISSVAKHLLADERVNPSAQNNAALKAACANNNLVLVQMLMNHPKIVIDDAVSNIFLVACKASFNLPVIETLVKDPRLDIAVNNQRALLSAVADGRYDLVLLLANDTRIDPSFNDNEALKLALSRRKKYTGQKVYDVLIGHPRIFVTDEERIRFSTQF